MLQGSSSPSPNSTSSPTHKQSPAAAWIQRLNAPRSTSFDGGLELNSNGNGVSALGYGRPGHQEMEIIMDENGAGPSTPSAIASDLRRATSLRTAGVFGGAVRETVSFGAAGSNLTSSPNPAAALFSPPLASRHPLFSHHAVQAPASTGGVPSVHSSDQGPSSPAFMSDPGPSGPPSPSPSDLSSSAFSPASAFLSHFSSSMSLRPPQNLAPDAQGARVSDYVLGKVIGRGGFSTVRKATHVTTGEVLACKIVKRDDLSDRSGSLEKFEDEIRIWQSLPRHPSLLPLVEMHRTPFATFLFTPYMSGGSLLDVLQREGGSDKTARKWFPGVVNAVQVLHEGHEGFEGGILHGDLKLDNFLVDQTGSVMVADFYMAQKIQDGDHLQEMNLTVPPPLAPRNSPLGRNATLPSGYHRGPRMSSPLPASKHHRPNEHPLPENITPHPTQPFPSASLPYAPPELLRAPPAGPSLAQDVWALGIILHALLTGRLPFVDAFDPRLQMKILRGAWEEPPFLGREWAECLHGCLDGNKESRWTVRRVKESDAVMGWAEVKSRSKSRSRSRARMGMGINDGYADTRRRDGSVGSGPVSIGSPFVRGRGRKHSTASSGSASASRDRMFQPTQQHDDRLDVFASRPPNPSTSKRRDDPRHPRSRSASASRSRSSGNDHRPMFTLDAPDLVRSLEAVDTARGRTARRGETNSNNIGLNIPGLPYARQSGEIAISGLPIPGYSDSRSQSRSRPRITIQPQSAPSYPTNFGNSLSSAPSPYMPMNVNVNANVPPSPRELSTSGSTRSSHSPSVNRGGRSLSRSRDSPVWEVSQQPERYSYGRELDMVHEEKGRVVHEEDHSADRERGRTGRSRSRGRTGRGY
ncbi:hypothetical protein I302_108947 [Kwoniella bestiolae CBS 10118]|uniref:CAMK protein kinase n=1 Tax=Kwoniella bestiolae CBS 10118 TaxID=1296100 RepID=A0A1B9FUJ7_9TREE|nr:CAMK protein kinase [Kwoniella bestiolae CBS 10118]OCF22440.1 CAMK protein kinase [Kwoniella bestiolae CBS 10118]